MVINYLNLTEEEEKTTNSFNPIIIIIHSLSYIYIYKDNLRLTIQITRSSNISDILYISTRINWVSYTTIPYA